MISAQPWTIQSRLRQLDCITRRYKNRTKFYIMPIQVVSKRADPGYVVIGSIFTPPLDGATGSINLKPVDLEKKYLHFMLNLRI